MHPLDRATRSLVHLGAAAPGLALLAETRARAAEQVRLKYRDAAADLQPALVRGSADARAALAAIARRALSDFHERVLSQRRTPLHGLVGRLDRWWNTPKEGEYIDDPALDAGLRQRAMADLDTLNEIVDSYRLFLDQLRPLLAVDRPTRILDLAAGHGGFALAMARTARAEGLAIEITATDLLQEYLDLGAARADAEGLPVRFARQDALDLSNIEVGAYDVVVSTQSIHHFPPELVAVMFQAATSIAARGVVFIDGCRSVTKALPLVAYSALRFRNSVLTHDALISFRRFFVPEELGLLARLGPWGDGAEAGWRQPDHCQVTLAVGAPISRASR